MEAIIFTEGNTKDFENTLRVEMEKPIKHFEKELASVRTGRASTGLVETLKVECYGQIMTLKELATLSAPDARLITIQPWDKTIIGDIEKAIKNSDLGINPINDGTLIRLQLPMMSSSRREELVKVLNKKTEECKIGIRAVRKDFHNQLRDTEKAKGISEDFASRLTDLLQKITDEFTKKVDTMHDKKANELRSIEVKIEG
ncbi:ribosome recycling factor [Candidatus Babeliales bacterium]|nr:ribosome recycling factor [Candidatus Babeliales bacterium]MCF7899251.1 ribosome recycling factor [Candidatus Babeliales bacterium]